MPSAVLYKPFSYANVAMIDVAIQSNMHINRNEAICLLVSNILRPIFLQILMLPLLLCAY